MDTDNPYRAPMSAVADARTGVPGQHEFRSPQTLRTTVMTLLVGMTIMSILLIVTMALLQESLRLLESHQFSSRQALEIEIRTRGQTQAVLAGLEALLTLITYIASGMWIYRVARNVRSFGAQGLDDSPGWAVGWYFVPFMCLQRPFRAMEQIWLASQSPLGWQKMPTPILLRCWWGLWLALCIHGWFVMQSSLSGGAHGHTIAELIGSESNLIFGQVIEIAALTGFLLVVLRITRMQVGQSGRAAMPRP